MVQPLTGKPLPKFETGKTICFSDSGWLTSHAGDDYEMTHTIGAGAYGQVVAAIHTPSGRRVAIKKIMPFDHVVCALRTLRELMFLKYFTQSSCNGNVCVPSFRVHWTLRIICTLQIITILDIIKPKSIESFDNVYCSSKPLFRLVPYVISSSYSRTYANRSTPSHPYSISDR